MLPVYAVYTHMYSAYYASIHTYGPVYASMHTCVVLWLYMQNRNSNVSLSCGLIKHLCSESPS